MKRFLAFDLGAESGRAMLGSYDGDSLALEELHRFSNSPVRLDTGLYWDTLRLFHEIQTGMTIAGRDRHLKIEGIGVCTWGVDFGILGSDGALVDNPRHYRDSRNDGMVERLFEAVPRDEVFAATGVQIMQINSLYQWFAMKVHNAPGLAATSRLLHIPDLFNYWLTGVQKSERTIASTSQFYDPATRQWAAPLLSKLGLDASILTDLVDPGARLGPILPWLAQLTHLEGAQVYATAGHDTASAVAAVPAETPDGWCYISSGTWSLMGVEIDEPVINVKSRELNFTNEIGVAGKVRLLKNIAGLWLLQECRRHWESEGQSFTYEELTNLAEGARPNVAIIDPDAFLHPGEMPLKISAWCRAHGQPVPHSVGEIARVILESLAHRYNQVLEMLESLTGKRIHTIHIVGGGSRNHLLNRLVAQVTGRRVVAGPTEATAIGNVLTQAIGAGVVKDLAEARAIVRRSFEVTEAK